MLYRIVALCLAFSACAQDDAISTGLAKGAAHLAAAGKTEKAKDMLFQALAIDANNPLALLELSKLSADDAGDLCWRAYQAADKKDTQLLTSILRQMAKCNPAGAKIIQATESYNTALADIGRRYTDEFTAAELAGRGVRSAGMPKVAGLTKENVPGRYRVTGDSRGNELEIFANGTQTGVQGFRKPEYHWDIVKGDLVFYWVSDSQTFKLQPDGSLYAEAQKLRLEKINRQQQALKK